MTTENDPKTIFHDGKIDLNEAQKTIGGYIRPLYGLRGDRVLLCDEDGEPKNLPLNHEASRLAGQPIRGTVIILDSKEMME